jgi:DNA-binding CsgD family transcriptional regulator
MNTKIDLKSLSAALIQTIQDPSKWQTALKALCEYTHTQKALISLRDKKTARIVIPDDVSEDFASPLIYGFDKAQVEAFLGAFNEQDPWTEIECLNHPYFPYHMSRYLPLEQLQQSLIWPWLEEAEISECIVCELGQTETYWAALNLYFDPASPTETQLVLERLKEVLSLLQSVWASARAFQLVQTAASSVDMVLAAIAYPAAIVSKEGELIAQNVSMQHFLQEADIAVARGQQLGLPMNLWDEETTQQDAPDLLRTAPIQYRGQITIQAYNSTQFADGEMRDSYLLCIEPRASKSMVEGANVWDVQSLTEREQTLVRHVAEGMKFSEAQIEMGLSYPRIMQIWKSARTKLEVSDVNELRLNHQIRQG